MVSRIGFIVNPIAGMGGKVGLKGTDGVLTKALELGAQPVAPEKAEAMLKEYKTQYTEENPIKWYTCDGDMGRNELHSAGFTDIEIVYAPPSNKTSATDTKQACQYFLKTPVDLLLFCGGDGTARDIYEIIGDAIPLLGIPAGVKMHSAVFGITTSATAKILHEFIHKRLIIGDVDIMDLDEDRYRKGEWNIRLFGIAKGIIEPTYVQVGKTLYESVSDNEIKDELTEHLSEEMDGHPEYLYFFGSGGTIDYIARKMNLDNTLLGIDAVYHKKLVQKDLNEKGILHLLSKYHNVKLVLSPIGAQGFILGRGNLQLSSKVVKKIGVDNIIVVSTPSKLVHTPVLRVDTGDKKLDQVFAKLGYLMVVIGYRLSRVVRIQTNNF